MVELAQPDFFVASEPRMQIVNVPSAIAGPTPAEVRFFRTATPYIWRVRAVAVHGRLDGTMGTAVLGLSFDISAFAGEPWTNAANDSGIQSHSPQVLAFDDNFAYTWSTEIGDNYVASTNQWGKTAVLGLPMVWLPAHTDVVIELSGFGGYDGNLVTRDGYMMIEYLMPGSGTGGSESYALWLQPVT